MGSESNEITGPDLSKGVTVAEFKGKSVLLGHVGDEAVMLVQAGTEFHAVSPSCTHYGGPLNEGVIHGDTVTCPWHNACFSLKTGEAIGAPGRW